MCDFPNIYLNIAKIKQASDNELCSFLLAMIELQMYNIPFIIYHLFIYYLLLNKSVLPFFNCIYVRLTYGHLGGILANSHKSFSEQTLHMTPKLLVVGSVFYSCSFVFCPLVRLKFQFIKGNFLF